MITSYREAFNSQFSEEKYHSLLSGLESYAGHSIPFRVSETPVFIPGALKEKLLSACDDIIRLISSKQYYHKSSRAIPKDQFVPGNDERPMWLAMDFAVCLDEKGWPEPRLIEMQGFPSLFGYQHILAKKYRQYFNIPETVSHIPGMSETEYREILRSMLIGKFDPKNVILLEVEPEKQNTRIDFTATEKLAGIRTVCISKLKKSGKELYYSHDGENIPIRRIYNRVIFDEFLKRSDLQCEFKMIDDVDVEWAGHPNWFFRMSKFTLPFLDSDFVPATFFLDEMKNIPADLENYVLKPLFSFSGSGVIFHVTQDDIAGIKDPGNWILQRKVEYTPVIKTPGGNIKAEIRMLYGWPEGQAMPIWLTNLVRLSQGEMIGVKYNSDKTWVGSSIAFFE